MSGEMMSLRGLLEKSPDTDFLREMIGFAAQRLMELEVGGLTGAGFGEKSPERLAQRNGYRERDWETRAGTVEPQSATAFLPVSIAPDSVSLSPAPVLDQNSQDHSPAGMLDRPQRVEIVLSAGRRVIAEGDVDIDVMLRLARGLEALR